MPLCECEKHGWQSVVLISPDLRLDAAQTGISPKIVDIFVESDGALLAVIHVSPEFASRHGLTQNVFPFEDEEPAWERELIGACVRCFEEAHNGRFVEWQWKPQSSGDDH
jgi:hypothetical protein